MSLNSSVISTDVRMAITAAPPVGFPAVSTAQGGKRAGVAVTLPPQQLGLGLNLAAQNWSSAWLWRISKAWRLASHAGEPGSSLGEGWLHWQRARWRCCGAVGRSQPGHSHILNFFFFFSKHFSEETSAVPQACTRAEDQNKGLLSFY